MSDFRARLGEQLGGAAAALARGGAEVDFRARLGAQLTQALVELQRERAAAIVPSGVYVLPQPAGDASGAVPAGDFAARFGVALTAAARLAQQPAPLRIPADAADTRARGRLSRRPARDFRARLGVQLTAAATAFAPARASGLASPARAAPRRRLALVPRVARPLGVGVAALALAGAATAGSLWLVAVGNPNGGVNPGLSATAPPATQTAALAVLRRPQTAADRGPGVQTALQDVNDFTTGVRSNYVRVLEVTGNGPVVLVPVAERDAGPVGGGTVHSMADALCIYYPVAGAGALGSSPACWSTAELLADTAVSAADGRIFGLAPDGVTSVTISVTGAPPISAPVTGNFFDAPLSAPAPTTSLGGAAPPAKMPVVTFHRG